MTIFRGTKHPFFTLILMGIVYSQDCAKQTTLICCHNSLVWIVNIVTSGSSYGLNEKLEWFGSLLYFQMIKRAKTARLHLGKDRGRALKYHTLTADKGMNTDKTF